MLLCFSTENISLQNTEIALVELFENNETVFSEIERKCDDPIDSSDSQSRISNRSFDVTGCLDSGYIIMRYLEEPYVISSKWGFRYFSNLNESFVDSTFNVYNELWVNYDDLAPYEIAHRRLTDKWYLTLDSPKLN
jgi:hypothetical protein